MSENRNDPLWPLFHALATGQAPPLDWVVEWSAGGHDPVTAAWGRSRDPVLMMDVAVRGLLARAVLPAFSRVTELALRDEAPVSRLHAGLFAAITVWGRGRPTDKSLARIRAAGERAMRDRDDSRRPSIGALYWLAIYAHVATCAALGLPMPINPFSHEAYDVAESRRSTEIYTEIYTTSLALALTKLPHVRSLPKRLRDALPAPTSALLETL